MKKAQSGFTLVELMIASAATGIVLLGATAFFYRAMAWHDEIAAIIEINRHARETYNLLAFGGKANVNGNDATPNVYGVRGRKTAPASGMRSNYALQYQSNNLTLTPDTFAPLSVTCTGAGTPLPDCTSTETRSVAGWLGQNIGVTTDRSVLNKTVEVTLTVTNPFQALRAKNSTRFTDKYRTIFTLNRTENDP